MVNVRRHSACERSRQLASLRLDAEATPFEVVLLERHLAACERCRSFVGDLERIARALRETPLLPLERQVAVLGRARRRGPRVAVAAAVAAALAAGLAGPTSRTAGPPQPVRGDSTFNVDRDLRDLRREQLKPPPVHLPGARSLDVL